MNFKRRPNYLLSTKKSLNIKTDSFKETKWRKVYHATTNQMKARVAILNSTRADFRTKKLSG